jgi:hypothetical protein
VASARICATGGIDSASSTFADIHTQAMAKRFFRKIAIVAEFRKRSKREMEVKSVAQENEYAVHIEAWKFKSGRRVDIGIFDGREIGGVNVI